MDVSPNINESLFMPGKNHRRVGKDLQIRGEGGEERESQKEAHVGRGQESK
jgi:hypothetical protein